MAPQLLCFIASLRIASSTATTATPVPGLMHARFWGDPQIIEFGVLTFEAVHAGYSSGEFLDGSLHWGSYYDYDARPFHHTLGSSNLGSVLACIATDYPEAGVLNLRPTSKTRLLLRTSP